MNPGTMSRRAKGRIAAPPRLHEAAQRVADSVAALPGVVAQAHWEIGSQQDVNGIDFYVGEEEVGHIHLDGEAHIAVGARLGRALVARQMAKPFRWSREFVVVDTSDHDRALQIFALRRAQIDGISERELEARIASL